MNCIFSVSFLILESLVLIFWFAVPVGGGGGTRGARHGRGNRAADPRTRHSGEQNKLAQLGGPHFLQGKFVYLK